MDRQPAVKSLVARLESHYDATYQQPGQGPSSENDPDDEPAQLSPEIEQFLKELDRDL